jgi:electron transfer flavoprotein alpha subunit
MGEAAALIGAHSRVAGGYFLGGVPGAAKGSLQRTAYRGRLQAVFDLDSWPPITVVGNGEPGAAAGELRWWLNRLAPGGRLEPWWAHLTPRPVDLTHLTQAPVIIDVGYGIGDQQGMDRVVPALQAALEAAGLGPVAVGATRKVTQDLKLLPVDRQIGQTGVSVRPRLLLALGVSGAPQHMDWIDPGATILAFNSDPGAPIMHWNTTHPAPRVHPIPGDLFATVPAFCDALAGVAVTAGP